uniref:Remorin_C domain-containing protein n=1 Tax=Panagrellus redivivus TaxID=6233 RepID=A0A7E4W5S0_PANRE
MLCLSGGRYQIELLPGHNLDAMIDSLKPTEVQSRPGSAWSTDANGDSGFLGSERSNFSSRPSSAMSTRSASSEVCPLRSMKPTSKPMFTSPEEVIAIYDKVRRDREAHRSEFHNYVWKKSAELDAMKRAEIAAIEAKY